MAWRSPKPSNWSSARGSSPASSPGVLDPTIVDLELSSKSVHFRMSGGGELAIAGFDLAKGDFLIDISPTHYELRAEMTILEGAQGGVLIVGVHGLADFEGFEDPEFKLQFWFRSPALQWLGQKIEKAFQDLGQAIEDFGKALGKGAETAWDEVTTFVEDLFTKDEYDPFEGLSTPDEIFGKMIEIHQSCQRMRSDPFFIELFKALRIDITKMDDEGASASTDGSVEVANVAPGLTLAGPTEVDEADLAEWTLTIEDPGAADVIDVAIDWGDGAKETVRVLPSEDRSPTRSATLSHAWADDNPTGTPQDAYKITVSAHDTDTGRRRPAPS